MANNDLIMTLGKVIIAAAWADGEITNDEENCLKDLIYNLPDVTAHQWAELEIYMDSPIGDAERARLVADLRDQTRSEEQRALALQTLQDMATADGEVTAAEQAIVAEVQQALETADVGVWGLFSRSLINRRSEAVVDAPNREKDLEDFVNNRLYYRVKQQLAGANVDLDLSDRDLRRLSLAGGLMGVVAHMTPEITSGERAAISSALQQYWAVSPEQATFVTEAAVSPDMAGQDFYRLMREFSEETTLEERQQFMKVLFAVAAADGQATHEEIEQLRTVAQGMKLTHSEFIEAKLSLPREMRAS